MMIIILIALSVMLVVFNLSNSKKMKAQKEEVKNSVQVGDIVSIYAGNIAKVEQVGEKYVRLNTGQSSMVVVKEAIFKILDINEVEFFQDLVDAKPLLNTLENANDVRVEVMQPTPKSKRDEYGF